MKRLVTGMLVALAATAAFAQDFDVRTFGAKCDGSTDDSSVVQKAATAAAGKTLIVPSGATCVVKNISLAANTRLINRGTLKLKALSANDGSPILIVAGDNVEIDGGVYDGNVTNQSADGYHDSYNSGANGKGRAYRAAIIAASRTAVNVHDARFTSTYGAALATQNSDKIRFVNNDCDSLKFECAFLSTTAGGHADAIITGNRAKDLASGDATVNANGILVSQMDRVLIANNVIQNVERTHIKSEGGNYIVIADNVLTTNTVDNFPAITIQQNAATDFAITGNVARNVGAGMLLTAPTLTYGAISGNVVDTTTGASAADGIQLNGATSMTDIVVSANTFRNIKREGIYLPSTGSRIKIVGNSLTGQSSSGQQALLFGGTGTADSVTVENNFMANFAHDAVNDGVVSNAAISGGTYTNFVFRGNTVLAAGSANRGVTLAYSANSMSGVFENNYVDGSATGPQTGLKNGVNTVSGINTLGTGMAGVAWRTAPTYGATVSIDASLGNEFDITATNGVAFTISSPTNGKDGQRITLTIRNTSGGALGAITWGAAYKMSAWTSPATGNSRSIDFRYDGTNWVQVGQTGVDVPN